MTRWNSFVSVVKHRWMRFAHVMGRVQTRVLLTIFFVAVLPFAVCMQLVQKKKKVPSWDVAKKFPDSIIDARDFF